MTAPAPHHTQNWLLNGHTINKLIYHLEVFSMVVCRSNCDTVTNSMEYINEPITRSAV